jgi:DNA-binding GntR family transcriptional regulator
MTTPSRQVPLKQRAYDAILERILGGQFAPGELLNRRGAAQELGMSAAPVHEAMIQLERDGFLEALPRLGTRVRAAGREDVRGHLIVREALECQAARLICGERVRQAMPRLKPLAATADSVAQSDADRARQEVAFHVALVELADCPALLREYRRVMQIGLFYRINLAMNMPLREPAHRHLALIKELCAESPEAAEKACRRHVWSGKPDSLKGAQPVPGRKQRGASNA